MGKLHLRIVSEVSDFRNLHESWNCVLEDSPDRNIFLTWEWQFTWWKHFGRGKDLNILVVEDDGQVIAIAPLMRSGVGIGGLRIETLQNISYDIGDYGGIILGERDEEALALLVGYLESEAARNTTVTISKVPEDSRLVSLLRKGFPSLRSSLAQIESTAFFCPYRVTEESDVVIMPRAHGLARRLKKLNAAHDVGFTYHRNGSLESSMEALFQLHEKRWEGKAEKYQGSFSTAEKRAFSMDVVNALDQRMLVRLSFLTADGNPISGVLGFQFGGRYYYFRPAFDPEYAQYAPGHAHIFHLVKESVSRGVTVFDFLRGSDSYKMLWAQSDRHILTLRFMRPDIIGKSYWAFFKMTQKLGRLWLRVSPA